MRRLAIAIAIVLALAIGWWATPRRDGGGPDRGTKRDGPPPVDGAVDGRIRDTNSPPDDPVPLADDPQYVGSAVCADCHAEIAATYEAHPMFDSTRPIDAEELEYAAGGARVVGRQRVLDVEVVDDRMRHTERMFDDDGELLYEDPHDMDYVVGSGRRGRAYLERNAAMLHMSPLNWYASEQGWDLAPSYVADDARRFGRRATDDCLACHAGRVAAFAAGANRYPVPAFHETSIGCERCHGPGREHVEFHGSGGAIDSGIDPIVNPANLEAPLRESVCYQCHLHAKVRVARSGRNDIDFVPGENVEDVWTFLDPAGATAFESVGQVQQMRASRCFIESDGAMGCISCHDPHRLPTPSERRDFYRGRCLECHEPPDCTELPTARQRVDDSCIECHMPSRRTRDIVHLAQTDHRVLRFGEPPEATAETESGELAILSMSDLELEPWERDRALGLAAFLHRGAPNRPVPPEVAQWLEQVVAHRPDDAVVHDVLGTMALEANRLDEARRHYGRALRSPETRESALAGLLRVQYGSRQWAEALRTADELLNLGVESPATQAIRADVLRLLGRRAEAIAAAERALELDPTLVPLREWLIETYDDPVRADRQRRMIEGMRTAAPP